MIDPNIALAYRSPQVPDPLEVAQQAQSLQNMRTQNQLGQQQIQAVQQENQIRNQAIQDDQNFRKMYAQSMTNGTQMTDDQILSTLGAQRGAQFLEHRNQATETRMRIKETQGKLAEQEADYAGGIAYALLKSADPKTGLIPAEAVGNAVQQAHRDGYEQEAQQFTQFAQQNPQQLPALLNQLVEKSPKQRALAASDQRAQAAEERARYAEQNALTNQKRAEDAEARAEQGKVVQSRDTRNGHALYYNNVTGAETVGGPVDMDASGGKGKAVTPDAALADRRANQKDYEQNAKGEITYRQTRDTLDSAIQNGKVYVYPNGRTVPFSSMKTADGNSLSQDDVNAYIADMKQRRDAAETGIEQSVTSKNDAMQRNGVKPQVSTQDAINAYRGNSEQPKGLPQGGGKQLDQAIAQTFLRAAGGDKNKARKLATQSGWKF